jgi:hypothetical protein
MRIKVLAFASSLLLTYNTSAGIPQSPSTPPSSPQAATLLAQSAKALTGSMVVNDVTLTGTVEWIAGSDDESGTVTYKGLGGAYRLDMTFRNGTRSEIVSPVNGRPSGNWIGLDSTSHPMAKHNLMVDPGWFPTIALGNAISSPISIFTYVGQETRNGASVVHLSAYQQSPNISSDVASRMQHSTQVEIYLDASTFLPVSYAYNSHPDNNALTDIPVEVRYSNYQNIGGLQIPFRVQKYINSTLAVDLHFQNATPNTGITLAQISTQ